MYIDILLHLHHDIKSYVQKLLFTSQVGHLDICVIFVNPPPPNHSSLPSTPTTYPTGTVMNTMGICTFAVQILLLVDRFPITSMQT